FPQVSFASVLDAADRHDSEFLRNHFQGRLVLVARIGREGEEDLHSTPLYYWTDTIAGTTRRTPGAEIHANAITTILDGREIRPLPAGQLLAATLALAAFVTFACVVLNPGAAALTAGAGLLAFAGLDINWTYARDILMQL